MCHMYFYSTHQLMSIFWFHFVSWQFILILHFFDIYYHLSAPTLVIDALLKGGRQLDSANCFSTIMEDWMYAASHCHMDHFASLISILLLF